MATLVRRIQQSIDIMPLNAVQWRVFVLCWMCALVDGFDVQAISFVGPALMRDLGFNLHIFGLIATMGLLGVFVGFLGQSALADRFGRKPVMVGSVLAFGILSLLTAYARSPLELALLRFATGIPLGTLVPNIVALTSEYAPARRRLFIGATMYSGFPLGAFIGGIAASQLIPLFGWQSVFILGAAAPLLLAPLLWWKLPESLSLLAVRRLSAAPGHTAHLRHRLVQTMRAMQMPETMITDYPEEDVGTHRLPRLAALLQPGRRPGTLLLWGAFFFNQIALYLLISWLPIIVTSGGGGLGSAALPLALLNLGSVGGGALLGIVSDRWGGARILPLSYLIGSLFCAVGSIIATSLAPLAILAIGIGFCLGGSQLIINGLAADFYPTALRSKGLGMVGFVARIGAACAPMLGGALMSEGGNVGSILIGAAAASGVAALSVLLLDRTRSWRERALEV